MMADHRRLRKCDAQLLIVTQKKPGHCWSGFDLTIFDIGAY